MHVRRLSPDALWIEMPLAAETPRLVWHAMAQCGLRNGKIDPHPEISPGPFYRWQENLVEGRTAQGLFGPQAVVQVQLTAHEGGTLLKFWASNVKQDFDFGSAWRAKRRLVPHIEEVLKDTPLDWHDEAFTETYRAPIPSPHDFMPNGPGMIPSIEPVIPLQMSLKASNEALLVWAPMLIALSMGYMHSWLPMFLVMAVREVWKWQTRQRKRQGLSLLSFLFYLAGAVYSSWLLIQRWI